MARNLSVGETVYIPRAKLGLEADYPSAFYRTEVKDVIDRSIEVRLPDGSTRRVASGAVRRNVGVLLFRVGDFDSEDTLLDPLGKSILQYCRLMLPDDMVRFCEVRTRREMRHFWQQYHGAHSHVVLVAHGSQTGIAFGGDGNIGPDELSSVLQEPGPDPKSFVSLCCKTGYASFAKAFSASGACAAFAAPFQSVHGAIASQFCQTFFAYQLLHGETIRVAFRHARDSIPGASHFRLWVRGELVAGMR